MQKKRFEGGDPTFKEGIKEAFKRIPNIFLWSIVSATVGLIIRLIEDSAQKSKNDMVKIVASIFASVIGAAWSIVSIFVVPSLVFRNVGPFQALKDSVETVKKTWGESLVRHYGLGLAQLVFVIAGILLIGVPGFLLLSVMPLAGLIAFGVLALYLIVVVLLFSTANTIFNTALYMYAQGKAPKLYSADTMEHAFVKEH